MAADHYVERPVANLSLRVPDELLARFDGWSAAHGGRAPALRRLMDQAAGGSSAYVRRLPARPLKLTVRLSVVDGRGLAAEAPAMGLTANAWAAAVLRFRLHGRPTLRPTDDREVIAIRGALRRIGVNVNQIARALNTAVLEGKVLDLELGALEEFRAEIRAHIGALGEAFEGNLAYWQGAG